MKGTIILILVLALLESCSAKVQEPQSPINSYTKISNSKPDYSMDTINTDQFWSLIDNSVIASNGDKFLQANYLTTELEKLSLEEITNFEIAFCKCVIDADNYNIMAAQKIIKGYVSDDSNLYFRCWIIGQGKTAYSEIIKNADSLSLLLNKGEECDWEELMYVATKAYSAKSGKDEDETFPRDIAVKMGLDYDFNPPPTKGEDWTEDELPTLLPKLWKKYN
jgi:Protein of unknown function (DUF4240)